MRGAREVSILLSPGTARTARSRLTGSRWGFVALPADLGILDDTVAKVSGRFVTNRHSNPLERERRSPTRWPVDATQVTRFWSRLRERGRHRCQTVRQCATKP